MSAADLLRATLLLLEPAGRPDLRGRFNALVGSGDPAGPVSSAALCEAIRRYLNEEDA